jgi:hypothetical protein
MFLGVEGSRFARDSMTQKAIFRDDGWIHQFPKARTDLYFLLDDGWDVGLGVHPDQHYEAFGSLAPDEARFPMFQGNPMERLRAFNEAVKAHGWRGLGIRVAAHNVGKCLPETGQGAEDYWTERMEWCRDAGVHYWKVDWGRHAHSAEFRKMLTLLAAKIAPELIIEHAFCCGPVNAFGNNPRLRGTRFAESNPKIIEMADVFRFSEVFRTYDAIYQLSTPITLDRAAFLLAREGGIINCEDDLYLAAALGCTSGVMRSRHWETYPLVRYDPWDERLRLDEVLRMTRLQRITPAFAGGTLATSETVLKDQWSFEMGDGWFGEAIGETVTQAAPAIVARNLPLPEVLMSESGSMAPYVVASKNPNGAVCVASLGRVAPVNKIVWPAARVTLNLDQLPAYLGVLGNYEELALRISNPSQPVRVFAQDLAGDEALDVTAQVEWCNGIMRIPGSLIMREGLSAATPLDPSQPGVILMFAE